MLRRLPFVAALLAGTALIVVPLAKHELAGSKAADRLVVGAAPILTKPSLASLRADLTEGVATADAVNGPAITTLASLSKQTPEAFRASLATDAPTVSKGLDQLPAIKTLADKIVTNLELGRRKFDAAKSLPGPGLDLYQATWAGIVLGVVLVVVGALGFFRPKRGLALVLTLVGIALVVAPLALRYPSKTADTDALLDSLRPFSVEKVQARAQALKSVEGLLDGLSNTVIPNVAAKAGTTPAAVKADLGAASPRLSPAAQQRTAKIIKRFATLVDFSGVIQPLLVKSTQLPSRAITWLLILPGAVLVLGGVAGLAGIARATTDRAV